MHVCNQCSGALLCMDWNLGSFGRSHVYNYPQLYAWYRVITSNYLLFVHFFYIFVVFETGVG